MKLTTVFIFLFFSLLCLPAQSQRAPNSQYEFADFVEPDFPFITTTLDAGSVGHPFPERNVAVRCLVLVLGGDNYACFDTDLLRVAATWQGEFMSLVTMAQISYHQAGNKGNKIPEILGSSLTGTGVYPGWLREGASFVDPRPAGPNPDEAGRGPIDASLGYWHGVYMAGNEPVLRYRVGETEIAEVVSSTPGSSSIVRTFALDKQDEVLTLVLAEYTKTDHVQMNKHDGRVRIGDDTFHFKLGGELDGVQLVMHDGQYVAVQISPAQERSLGVAVWKGSPDAEEKKQKDIRVTVPEYQQGGTSRWKEEVSTAFVLGEEVSQGYVIDQLELPIPNPWRRNVRIAGIDFFTDGRAAVSTFEGDIWIISGLTNANKSLTWKRYASGLYEPMSLSIVEDQVYVFGREGILRFTDLNDDGEADFYENFSNLPIQTIESREYPHSMHPRPEGGFYVSKGAALNMGPKTNESIMNGFRAGGPHSGTILKISADGKDIDYFATGLREPYIGVHPEKGWVTASDQQGHFVPSSPIYFVQEGDYYGVPATAHQDVPPEIALPLTWVPHNVDRSGTEQVWITSNQFGPLNGALIHLSYGQPGLFLVYAREEGGKLVDGAFTDLPISFSGPLMEGAVHPIDGQLYLGGFQVWDSNAQDVSNLYRMRYAGGEMTIPIGIKKGEQGVILYFDVELDKGSAENTDNYKAGRWNYKRTEMYGSGIFRRNGFPGKERVRVANAMLSPDGRSIFIQLHDMQDIMQNELSFTLKTAEGVDVEKSIYFSWQNEGALDLVAEGFGESALVAVEEDIGEEEVVPEKVPTRERGQEIYQQIGCMGCHSIDGSTEGKTGPTFLGLLGKVREFNDGTSQVADEEYIRESIYEPNAKEVKGREVEMPSYIGLLDEADVASIILFIQSLDKSD